MKSHGGEIAKSVGTLLILSVGEDLKVQSVHATMSHTWESITMATVYNQRNS